MGGVRDLTLGVWNTIKDAFQVAMDFIISVGTTAWEALQFLWENKTAILKGAWDIFWDGIMFYLEITIQAITIAAVAFYQLFTGDWDGFLNTLSTTWTAIWTAISQF
jgi:phage-related protein